MITHQSKIEKLISELCPNGVEFKELRKFADILNGYSFKSNKYSKDGIRVIRISDVQKGKMSNKDLKYYPIETEKEISRFLLKENDLVMSLTGNVGRVAMLSKLDLPAGLNQRVACIRINDDKVLTRYLFHFFDQDTFETEAMNNATGGGQKNMSTTWLGKYKIPIPPLAIQEEIVKILDSFTELGAELGAELEAELEARKKQYEHYRSKLLAFSDIEEVQWVKLMDVASYSKTRIEATKLDNESYVGVDNLLQNKQGKMLSSYVPKTGKLTHYENKDILIGNIRPYLKKIWHAKNTGGTNGDVLVIRIDEKNKMNSEFLYYLLSSDKFFEYNMQFAKGAKMPRGDKSAIMKFEIPLPPVSEQERVVSILNKFELLVNDISIGLPAELKARQQQYEYYRNKLLTFKEYAK